jgi:hypothetical protein
MVYNNRNDTFGDINGHRNRNGDCKMKVTDEGVGLSEYLTHFFAMLIASETRTLDIDKNAVICLED